MLSRFLAGLFALIAFTLPALAEPVVLTGTVVYRERIALPAGAQLRLQLVTLADGRQIASATSRITAQSQPPIAFTMNLRSNSAPSAGPLGLLAEIRSGGQVLFASPAPTPIDLAAPSGIAILVHRASSPTPAPPPPEPPMPDPQLLDTSWTVTSIGGRPVVGLRAPTLAIAADHRIGGNSGCNSYFAEASIEGSILSFSPAAATRMACAPEIMDQENAYFTALSAVAAFELDKDSLRLLDAAGVPLIGLVRATE